MLHAIIVLCRLVIRIHCQPCCTNNTLSVVQCRGIFTTLPDNLQMKLSCFESLTP